MKWTGNNRLKGSTQISCDRHTSALFTAPLKAGFQTGVGTDPAACSVEAKYGRSAPEKLLIGY